MLITADDECDRGQTALICASMEGHVEVARLLVEAGADLSIKDWSGKTALDWANKDEIVELLE